MKSGAALRIAKVIWLVALGVLFAPVAALWALKLGTMLAGCVPQAAPCTAYPLGQWFKTILDAAMGWTITAGPLLGIVMAAAAIVCGGALRAIVGVFAPLAALVLTIVAAMTTTFADCHVSEGMTSGCTLWGADLNQSFNFAGTAPWLVIMGLPVVIVVAIIAAVAAIAVHHRREARKVRAV